MNIQFASQKVFVIEKIIVTIVVLIEVEIIIKEPFKLFQFFLRCFCSIRLFCFDFVNGIVVNKLRNEGGFFIFEKADFLIDILKTSMLNLRF